MVGIASGSRFSTQCSLSTSSPSCTQANRSSSSDIPASASGSLQAAQITAIRRVSPRQTLGSRPEVAPIDTGREMRELTEEDLQEGRPREKVLRIYIYIWDSEMGVSIVQRAPAPSGQRWRSVAAVMELGEETGGVTCKDLASLSLSPR